MIATKINRWEIQRKPVLTSSGEVRNHSKFKLAFKVDNSDPDAQLTLCWVDRAGQLRHFYPLGSFHLEHTYTGDAFVVFDRKLDQTKPVSADEIENVLCSFRTNQPPPPGEEYVVSLQLKVGPTGALVCRSSVESAASSEEEYRVIVRFPNESYHLPNHLSDWTLEYVFVCPPMPRGDLFNKHLETFYIWGDLSFGNYGAAARHRSASAQALHDYKMNQIVPQLMCGRCLAANDESFKPIWQEFDSWVIQAQYYWQTGEEEDKNSRAQCGSIVKVFAKETLRSLFRYVAATGKIHVSIEVVGRENACSEITIDRPFPNDPNLFESWSTFFQRCEEVDKSSRGCSGRPTLNVEYKGRCNVKTLKSVCPFRIKRASYPGYEDTSVSQWRSELFAPSLGRVQRLNGGEDAILRLEESVSLGEGIGHVKARLSNCLHTLPCFRYSNWRNPV